MKDTETSTGTEGLSMRDLFFTWIPRVFMGMAVALGLLLVLENAILEEHDDPVAIPRPVSASTPEAIDHSLLDAWMADVDADALAETLVIGAVMVPCAWDGRALNLQLYTGDVPSGVTPTQRVALTRAYIDAWATRFGCEGSRE